MYKWNLKHFVDFFFFFFFPFFFFFWFSPKKTSMDAPPLIFTA